MLFALNGTRTSSNLNNCICKYSFGLLERRYVILYSYVTGRQNRLPNYITPTYETTIIRIHEHE